MAWSIRLALGAATVACGLAFGAVSASAVSDNVVISQVYGGGGNTDAPYQNDFIELFNRGETTASLDGWSVQYASAIGTGAFGATAVQVTPLSGALAPGQYALIREAAGANPAAPLPRPDFTDSTPIAMSATEGKVALVDTTASLGCNGGSTPCSPAALAHIVDLVGYGGADFFEGAGPAPALSNTTAALRNGAGAQDTDNNNADFTAGAPTPRNGYTEVRIHAIQGAAHLSPLSGTHASVPGIVTARRANGFWMQDPSPDADVSTSEAIFVFTSGAPGVSVGDAVEVGATVSEFRPGGASSTNLTTTQLSSPAVTVNSTGNPLPAPVTIGAAGRAPPSQVIENDASGDVETGGIFDPASDGIDFYESLEGMRVRLDDAVAVGPSNPFGEIPVVGDDGAGASIRTTRGGIVVRAGDFNPERVLLDDTLLPTPVADVGDHFTADVVGVLDYSFGNFKLFITEPVGAVDGGLAREVTAAPGVKESAIATFNVENLDPTDDEAKFDALAGQIVDNLRSPDVIALEEVQDNDGPANTAVTAADVTLSMLAAAIEARGGPAYEWREIAPADDQDGGEPGGNIRVAFLFRTDRGVAFVDRPGGDATTATAVLAGAGGPRLTFSPGRIDPTNSAFNASRKPLAAEFKVRNRKVFMIANHFNSKSADQPLFGRRQPPQLLSEAQRIQQARVVNSFVDEILAADPNASVVVLGDLNDFEFSAPIQALKGGVLGDLVETLPQPERYTYVFDGNSQTLDHILVTDRLLNSTPFEFDVVHINAEFADRTTDHDPPIVRFRLTGPGRE